MPAEDGNLRAFKHGARSERMLAGPTGDIVAEWTDPDEGLMLTLPVDRAAIVAVASAYARLQELTLYFDAPGPDGKPRGMVDSRGRPRGAARLYWSAFTAVMKGLDALGATPSSRAGMAGGLAALRGRADAEAAHKRLKASYANPESSDD
jgi:hypothetical protein